MPCETLTAPTDPRPLLNAGEALKFFLKFQRVPKAAQGECNNAALSAAAAKAREHLILQGRCFVALLPSAGWIYLNVPTGAFPIRLNR